MYKWKPSKAAAREYAEKKESLNSFLAKNQQIRSSLSQNSFYFEVNGKSVRISNHTVKASDRGCFDEFGNELRNSYHAEKYDIEITASPLRLEQIYNDLLAGHELNKRGFKKEKKQ